VIGIGTTLGAFQAKMGLNTADYAKGIINANSMNRLFGESFTAFVSNPLLGSIQILKNVSGAFVAAASKQLEYAEVLQRTSQQLGVSEQLLVALTKRLEVAGYAGDIGAKSLQKFATSLLDLQRGAGPLKEVGDAIGLTLDPLADLDTNLRTVLDTIARLPGEAQRSAAAAKIFGEEAGPKLLNAIGGGSAALRDMMLEMRQLGFRVDELGNDKLADLNTQLGYMKLAVEGIRFNAMREFMRGFAGDTEAGTEGIREMASGINDELGPAMADLGQTFREMLPDLKEMAKLLAEVAGTVGSVRDAYDGSAVQWWNRNVRSPMADVGTSLLQGRFREAGGEWIRWVSPWH
jgi:hypothetical protein